MAAERLSCHPTLATLLEGIATAPPVAIAGIAADSRRVGTGDAFFACRGGRSHGLDYAGDVLRRGAAAIVWEDDGDVRFDAPAGVASVPVAHLGERMGEIANRWFGRPSESLRVCGVTGTNGKTTVSFLVAQCLNRLGRRCAYLGTLGAGFDSLYGAGGLTTPDCVELHRSLAAFRDEGARHAAIEVSSHGLEQRRVDGVCFDAAIFTNLSRDHIDYHGSMAAYGDAKARLFLDYRPAIRVIGLGSEFGAELARRAGDDAIVVATGTGRDAGAHPYLFVTGAVATPTGTDIEVESTWGAGRGRLPLVGAFNVDNAAAVLALLLAHGVALEDALELLCTVDAPPGRMQRVAVDGDGPQVFVDYAHTPAALEAALTALRPHCRGALWCVFGCGGDRDRGKRPVMGEVVETFADRPVVTSDNPRSEAPGAIIDDVLGGMRRDVTAIEDRAEAIARAIAEAGDDDIVLIAGKGHETYQIVAEDRVAFSDYGAARANLEARARHGRR